MTGAHRPVFVGTTPTEFEAIAPALPIDGVGVHCTAIVWLVDPDRSSMLLVEHRLLGWSCPGGHLDPGDSFRAAARREAAEEVGPDVARHVDPVAAPLISVARTTGCARGGPETIHWTLGFLAEVPLDVVRIDEPGQRSRWFAFGELPGQPEDLRRLATVIAAG